MMNFPAFTVPTLRIGSTFDCNTAREGSDIFPPNIPTETEHVNAFSFRYKIVKTNEDVKELLNLPYDLSLRIKANLQNVEGLGKYINDLKIADGKTEVLAVMKCTTIAKKIKDFTKPNEDAQGNRLVAGLGTHYVRRVLYGGQIVASIKINLPSSAERTTMTGFVEGELTSQAVDTALSSQLDAFSAECRDATDISITYYTTEMPHQTAAICNIEELMSFFHHFRSNVMNSSQEIPVEVELQPLETLMRTEKAYLPNRALANALEEVESRFDDLRNSKFLLKKYLETVVELDEDIERFRHELEQVSQTFIAAISKLNVSAEENPFDNCLMAYGDALDGFDEEGKFVQFWKKLLMKKEKLVTSDTRNIQLPRGKDLTIVVTGKAGSGKSSTANSIVGKQIFTTSAGATSVSLQFQCGTRTDERKITVLDTPGFPETDIVREVPRILEWAPHGIDAIILVAKYGSRFNVEDAQALQQLRKFLGEGGDEYIILVLTYGDQAEHEAKEDKISVSYDACVELWLGTLPDWVQMFIGQIEERVVLFNNRLKPDRHPEAYKKQLSELIKLIDNITQRVPPYLHSKESRETLKEKIDEVMEVAMVKRDKELEKRKQTLGTLASHGDKITQRKPTNKNDTPEEGWLIVPIEETKDVEARGDQHSWRAVSVVWNMLGGCFPASAIFIDGRGQLRKMDSLRIGDEVQVITNDGIHLDTVFSFIHCQPEVVQEFLKITTMKNKILKITKDHLLFVEKMGQATAIPARDAKVGDTVYVKGKHGVEKDAVQSISTVYEKGVYAPVTLSGTILVNDVHTSCYFDVLSHEWSHRAMGVARAVHYVSPWMLQWISGVGQKDGFPGWCRLAHKMLTLAN